MDHRDHLGHYGYLRISSHDYGYDLFYYKYYDCVRDFVRLCSDFTHILSLAPHILYICTGPHLVMCICGGLLMFHFDYSKHLFLKYFGIALSAIHHYDRFPLVA